MTPKEQGETPEIEQAEPEAEPTTPEHTEDAFDKDRAMATIKKLREQEKALKARAKLADELEAENRKRAEAEMTEAERLKAALQEAEAKALAYERAERRRAAAAVVKLPPEFADRLRGETAEELAEDAERLAELLKQTAKPAAAQVGATAPADGKPVAETLEQKRRRLGIA